MFTFRNIARCARQQARGYATASKPQASKAGRNAAIGGGATILALTGWFANAEEKAKEAKDKLVPPTKVLKPDEWVDLKLVEITKINHNTSVFRFHLPEDSAVSGLEAASCLLTKYKGPNMEKPVIRPYTPVSDDEQRGYIDLLVKKYEGGPMSTHIHDMNVDQRLSFKGPIPKYKWEENKHNHVALIAGGTGIAPMYQLCRAIFKNPNDKTKVTLCFGNIAEEDILLKRQLEDLEQEFPQRFRAFYVLEKGPEEWKGGKGFIGKELLQTVLPSPDSENIKIFVCGPPAMYKAISGTKKSPKDQGELAGVLKELGYTEDQVFKF